MYKTVRYTNWERYCESIYERKLLSWGNRLDNLLRTLYPKCQVIGTLSPRLHGSQNINRKTVKIFQAESVKDAAFGCDWVGIAIPFQRCLMFIIATANKEFQLTAGKFVPVSNVTMMNVCIYLIMLAYLRQ